jgi:sugar lactone lactonase YvrE
MILAVHSNAGYANEKKSRSRAGGHFFLSNNDNFPPNNGAILTIATIIIAVMSSAAEAELGALYINAREAVYLRQIIEAMDHPQPRTLMQTDNTTAEGVINKKIQVLAHEKEMNQPNDLAFHPAGFIYASDPDWKKSIGQLWLIRSDGTTFCLEINMGTTNGIEVSPNGKYLYVNESVQRKIWRYNLDKQGFVSNKRLFYQFDDFGLDGMRCDIKGNLYVTRHGKGTVVCLNQKGKWVTEIQLKGTKPSNITFGGKDGKTAYVTLQDRGMLESFLVPFAGQDWFRFQKK